MNLETNSINYNDAKDMATHHFVKLWTVPILYPSIPRQPSRLTSTTVLSFPPLLLLRISYNGINVITTHWEVDIELHRSKRGQVDPLVICPQKHGVRLEVRRYM